MKSKKQYIRAFIEWRLYMLITNLLAWNILISVFIYSNFLINPDLFISGPKIFQLIHQSFTPLISIGTIIGIGAWLLEDVLFYRYLAKKSVGILFLMRLVFIILLLLVILLFTSIYHYQRKTFSSQSEYFSRIMDFIINKTTFYFFLIGIIISLIINSFKAIIQKVGYEKFYRIISGYYRTPREEDRIFIFIDLISSTRYAELLGHKKYSSFLLECFRGIGILQLKYRGTQYQFVGDEVVISWSAKRKQNYKNAVNFFFEFKQQLQSRTEYFQKEFGVIPNFTASINSGKIMMAEVGDLKSEIAFHGDVLNTAARIQKQCKSYDKELLVTEKFIGKLKEISEDYNIEWVANKKLTGKQHPVNIYSIQSGKTGIT